MWMYDEAIYWSCLAPRPLRLSRLSLSGQLEERASAIRLAQYNFDNCRVYAPFDGYVTNMTTAVGDYVHIGTQVFTMIDSRVWWVIANFRETQLRHVILGSGADVFLTSHEGAPLHGTV